MKKRKKTKKTEKKEENESMRVSERIENGARE